MTAVGELLVSELFENKHPLKVVHRRVLGVVGQLKTRHHQHRRDGKRGSGKRYTK